MRKLIAVVLLGAAGSCARGDGEHEARRGTALPQPTVRSLARLTLTENDTAYLGRPAALAVDPGDGSLYVTDAFLGRVLRFSADGRLLRGYGRRGDGPGELRDPGAVEVAGDEIVVADVGAHRLTRFGRDDGAFRASVRFRGVPTSIVPDRGRLWLGGLDVERKTSVGVWEPGDGEVRGLGSIPAQFTQSAPLAGIYSGAEVAAWNDTVLVGYEGLNRLTFFRPDGSEIRTLRVPVRARKGEMPDLVHSIEHLDFPEQFSANSVLFRIARLPGGNFALVYYDQTIDGSLITARVFLTLLSADFSRACVDRELPVSRDAQPYTAFRGDTLYIVQQAVRGEKASAYVDRYVIDEHACFGART
ncbi:MAG TPA: hypothetical protein VF092_04375 [Longimicrobium sp.]